ncbi:MAG: sulfur carrier protein ThiS [Candidatus Sumerlaeota bacterium]|nr:sulfur carrier protein ThiS [Candidatus Sumerlaeota bacterium]
MKIRVNGEIKDVPEGLSIIQLMNHLKIDAQHVAVEHNGEILEDQALTQTILRPEDQLEIVHFVGGG